MEYHMRKESREMPADFALDVLKKAPFVTLAMVDADGFPYSIPVSVASTRDNIFYFHGAMQGKKIDCIRHNSNVMLSAVTRSTPTVGPKDDSFTLQFASATARGKAELVTDETEKIEAMRAICQRYLPHHMDVFDVHVSRSISHTAVVRITLTEPPIGKRKQYDSNGDEMKYGRME